MWAVPTGKHQALDGSGNPSLDARELVDPAVRVLRSLDQQGGRRHQFGLGFDIPGSELRIEPDVTPAPERGVWVVVVTGHPLPQVTGEIFPSRLCNRAYRDVLDEHMRREQDESGDRPMGGVDERNRPAVAVSDQDRLWGIELGEQFREHIERLGMKERRRPRSGRPGRAAVPGA